MRPLVIIPYRNREVHLNCLTLYLNKYFPKLPIAVVEQADGKAWNKGLLFNAGFKEFNHVCDYIILHDVDFIPNRTVDYSYPKAPTLISGECSQFNYKLPYPHFFGGVVGIANPHFQLINGFSNQFRGWGGEDDLLYKSCVQKGLFPQIRNSRFENFIHPRPDTGKNFDSSDYKNNLRLATTPRDFSEGLSTADYTIVNREIREKYIHLKVSDNGQ